MTPREPFNAPPRRMKRRRTRLMVWSRFVMGIGYLTLGYGLVRGIIYLLVLAQEWTGK